MDPSQESSSRFHSYSALREVTAPDTGKSTIPSMQGYFSPRFWLLALVVVGAAAGAAVERRLQKRWATSYDQPFSYQCSRGTVLKYIRSEHSNHYEDRIWDFRCRPLSGLGECRISAPANNWDGDMNFQCPDGEIITGMSGVHNNHNEDRIFTFVCCKAQVRLSDCYWTGDLNRYDGPLQYVAPGNRVFHGVHSRHSNHHEDRIWRFEVCNAA